jgi:hypothetical protein
MMRYTCIDIRIGPAASVIRWLGAGGGKSG